MYVRTLEKAAHDAFLRFDEELFFVGAAGAERESSAAEGVATESGFSAIGVEIDDLAIGLSRGAQKNKAIGSDAITPVAEALNSGAAHRKGEGAIIKKDEVVARAVKLIKWPFLHYLKAGSSL